MVGNSTSRADERPETQIMAKGKPEKERRQHKRSKTKALAVAFEGQSCDTYDLSIGGTMITGYDGPLSAGSLLSVTGIGPSGGKMTDVKIRARVNRTGPGPGEVALTFLDLDERAYGILQDYMASRVLGLESPEAPGGKNPLAPPASPGHKDKS